MKILTRHAVDVDVDDLKFDKTNPNQLTEKQMQGLKQSMLKYGNLHPITIDQNYNIADGEHRALIYKAAGIKKIPCYKIKMESDTDRRLFRQIMNKLHGTHDIKMDADELQLLFNENKLQELSLMIGQEQKALENLIDRVVTDSRQKDNQQYNDTQEIESDAQKIKKRLDADEDSKGKTKCPKCGYVIYYYY